MTSRWLSPAEYLIGPRSNFIISKMSNSATLIRPMTRVSKKGKEKKKGVWFHLCITYLLSIDVGIIFFLILIRHDISKKKLTFFLNSVIFVQII